MRGARKALPIGRKRNAYKIYLEILNGKIKLEGQDLRGIKCYNSLHLEAK